MPSAVLTFMTDFADQAVIVPMFGTVALVLSWQRRWRVVMAWIGAVGAVLGTILVLKVACSTCAWMVTSLGPDYADLRSPSGHGASAAVTFAGIAALQARGSTSSPFWTSLVAAVAAAVVVGITRVELGAHSVAEVAVAAVIGIAGALAFVAFAGQQVRTRPGGPVLLCAALVATIMHGHHLPAEAAIQGSGVAWLRSVAPACDPARYGVDSQPARRDRRLDHRASDRPLGPLSEHAAPRPGAAIDLASELTDQVSGRTEMAGVTL